MHMKVFALPFNEEQETFDDRNLHAFLQGKHLVSKSDYLFEKNEKVYLAVVVRYAENGADAPAPDNSFAPAAGDPPVDGNRETSRNDSGVQAEAEETQPKTGGREKKQPYQPVGLSEAQMELFERMRKWRYERARTQFIPAYMICSNRELEKIIEIMPKTIDQLAAIEGMSGPKLKNHGESMIEALGRLTGN